MKNNYLQKLIAAIRVSVTNSCNVSKEGERKHRQKYENSSIGATCTLCIYIIGKTGSIDRVVFATALSETYRYAELTVEFPVKLGGVFEICDNHVLMLDAGFSIPYLKFVTARLIFT
ncbi:unnamed protein product [Acanthoscelides obtectus]|uniref:Uncharacterized protein n=1 Tax=Acanthoscelides obtectus TaxID=200917 RepID=A0A9P0P581_ACAOB|nr:unnamed protein product [Acanthoscelides obtectus]CAK1677175.1 hypothetical protein AOBTE_LOCUS31163 [Acanthoscelides obtectus]